MWRCEKSAITSCWLGCGAILLCAACEAVTPATERPRDLTSTASWRFGDGLLLSAVTCEPSPAVAGTSVHVQGLAESIEAGKFRFSLHAGASGEQLSQQIITVQGAWSVQLAVPATFQQSTVTVQAQRWATAGKATELELGAAVRRDRDGYPIAVRAQLCLLPIAPRPLIVHAAQAQSVVIDGVLDDAVWQRPGATLVDSLRGAPEEQWPTQTWLAWDQRNLYIAATLRDADMWNDLPLRRDQPLYQQDVFEVFVAADGSTADYLELGVAPTGAVYDGLFSSHRQGKMAWNGTWEARVRARGTVNRPRDRDDGWDVEVSLPWEDICLHTRLVCPMRAGARLRVNLFRLDKLERKYTRGWALSATKVPDFHAMQASAVVVLEKEPT